MSLRVNPVIARQPLANAPRCTAPGEAIVRERGGIRSPATFPFSQYVRMNPNRALDIGSTFSHIAKHPPHGSTPRSHPAGRIGDHEQADPLGLFLYQTKGESRRPA